jgi:hypothetical protein
VKTGHLLTSRARPVPVTNRSLTRAQFEQLADVAPEEKWLANIINSKSRRAYKNDARESRAAIRSPRTHHHWQSIRVHMISPRGGLSAQVWGNAFLRVC